ncbi:MAG TPA: TlpA disulfide reductase family protein [Gemmataceae bacterium]|nr:TlpA disulfide reductase family protein [Gemmataceae bacterium]
MTRIWLSFFALVLLIVSGCESNKVGLGVGQIAPDLQGTDTTGRSVNLSDFRGKVVMIDFWATWCGPCKEMVPHEKELTKRLEGQPFVLLGVSADNEQADLKSYMSKVGIPWTNIYDGPGGPLARSWRIDGLPTIVVVDAKGVIRYKQRGYDAESMSKIDNAIDKLLKDMRY